MTLVNPFLKYEPPPQKKRTSERSDLVSQIYALYSSEIDVRKKENWKRYITYLKANRVRNTPENQAKYKRSKQFIRELPVSSIAYLLSHIKTPELYYVLSEMKDHYNRGTGASKYLLGSIKKK